MSKIVDTLELSTPKEDNDTKYRDYHGDKLAEDPNKILSNDFLDELGLEKEDTKVFDCDVSSLNHGYGQHKFDRGQPVDLLNRKDSNDNKVEEELIQQMNLTKKQNLKSQKQKVSSRNRKEPAVKANNGRKEIKNKPSLREKFREKLAHGKEIEKNPSAFTEGDSIATINQNNTLNQINPRDPKNFQKKHYQNQAPPIVETEGEHLHHQNMKNHNQNFQPTQQPVDMYRLKEAQLMAELNNLEQYTPKIRVLENHLGVNRDYRHTKDFLNKENPEYEIDETMGYVDEFKVEQSVNNLNQLLLLKKHNQAIPFVQKYTPSSKNKTEMQKNEEVYDHFMNSSNTNKNAHHKVIPSHMEDPEDKYSNYVKDILEDKEDDEEDDENVTLEIDETEIKGMHPHHTMASIVTSKSYKVNPNHQQRQEKKFENYEIGSVVQEESAENYLESPFVKNKAQTQNNKNDDDDVSGLSFKPRGGGGGGYRQREKMRTIIKKEGGLLPKKDNGKKGDSDAEGFKTNKAGNMQIKEGVDLKKLFLD